MSDTTDPVSASVGFGSLVTLGAVANAAPSAQLLAEITGSIGLQTNTNTSTLGSLLTPINPQSVSFEAIRTDLINWAVNKPNGVAWADWFTTDDGTIIAEWIAGLATFRKLAETMRLREASLDYAQLSSSIYELAFNRGLLVAPAAAPLLSLGVSTTGNASVSVNVGDLVGTIGTYELYSLEGKTLLATDTLQVAVGHLNTYTSSFSTLSPFTMFRVPVLDQFVARELENFRAGGNTIPLAAELSNVAGVGNSFLLRRLTPSQVRLYVGNGVMGWYDASVPSITYTCLSYGTDVSDNLTSTPQLAINADLTSFTQTQPPSFDPDPETLRAIARYYPIDGRIVQDGDYEAVVRKYYGGVLADVFAFNTNPDEQVYLLANAAYGVGTDQANEQLSGIQALVDGKRGLGMQVHYYVIDPAEGKSLTLVFRVPARQYNYLLQQQVNQLMVSQLYRFARTNMVLSAVSFATQLSAKFGVQFTPSDPTLTLAMGPTDFLSSLTINLQAI